MVDYGRGKTMKNSQILTPKVEAVAHDSGRLLESFITEFTCETKREIQKVVAYWRWSLTRQRLSNMYYVMRNAIHSLHSRICCTYFFWKLESACPERRTTCIVISGYLEVCFTFAMWHKILRVQHVLTM